jgi:hypothetical protein
VVLRDLEELTIDEIAGRLGATRETVKARLHRARGLLPILSAVKVGAAGSRPEAFQAPSFIDLRDGEDSGGRLCARAEGQGLWADRFSIKGPVR